MAYDEKTPHLSLPLPHPRNTLREDCPRIRESLQALDRFAEKSDAAVAALAEADTTLANAMQSQGKDLAEAISQEEEARSQADADLAKLSDERLKALEERFDVNATLKADHLPLSDAVDSATGDLVASDRAVKTLNDRLNGLNGSPADRLLWLGVPRLWRSTTLPPNHCWANGDFVAFADWPELEQVYAAGGFEGMLMPWNADSEMQAANLGQWRPDAAEPTGLYTPNLVGQFLRCWATGADENAGAWHRDEIRNITGGCGTYSTCFYDVLSTGAIKNRPYTSNMGQIPAQGSGVYNTSSQWDFSASNVVPTGVQNVPQHIWQPVIIYLGTPQRKENI